MHKSKIEKSQLNEMDLDKSYRWDFFTLKLDKVDVDGIIRTSENRKFQRMILENCKVIRNSANALKHFGYANPMQGLNLKDLTNRWDELTRDENRSTGWIEELSEEIFRALSNKPPQPSWKPLKSVDRDTKNFLYPVVNHIRKVEGDRSVELDVYMPMILV